jgi:hypothetical protein
MPALLELRTPCVAIDNNGVPVKTVHIGTNVAQTAHITGDLNSK